MLLLTSREIFSKLPEFSGVPTIRLTTFQWMRRFFEFSIRDRLFLNNPNA